VELIPFQLDGIYGFQHLVKEVTTAIVFTINFMYFQKHYQDKTENLLERL
jgi:hypothetical protein